MTERIYTEAELRAEKPRGELLVRNDKGVLFRVFACWGCQTCWAIDPEADTIEQACPHFLSAKPVEE